MVTKDFHRVKCADFRPQVLTAQWSWPEISASWSHHHPATPKIPIPGYPQGSESTHERLGEISGLALGSLTNCYVLGAKSSHSTSTMLPELQYVIGRASAGAEGHT